jgi:hypothetical protein
MSGTGAALGSAMIRDEVGQDGGGLTEIWLERSILVFHIHVKHVEV